MTGKSSANKDKRTQGKNNRNRNKKTNADGIPYENRMGTYTQRDEAIEEATYAIASWFTPERYQAECSILNPPGKLGPKFKATPSMILYISMLMDLLELPYRRIIGFVRFIFELLDIPIIDFTTLFKDEDRFNSDFGENVMKEASKFLESKGFKEKIDPLSLIHSGVTPEYEAPQMIPTCQADVDKQKLKDQEAEYLRKNMEVMVFSDFIGCDATDTAIDGSGQTITGSGMYFEHIWNENNRSFIKQHPAIDLNTRMVMGFSITMEKPGDSRVFGPVVEALDKCGVNIGRIYADSAYDSKNNWKLCDSLDIEFNPNLKTTFGSDKDLPNRNTQLEKEQELGKKDFHRETGYNRRWLVEVFFSVIKRMYGERLRAKKFHKMVIRMRNIYRLHNIHRQFMCAVEGCGVR